MFYLMPIKELNEFVNDLEYRAYMKKRRIQIKNYEWRLKHKTKKAQPIPYVTNKEVNKPEPIKINNTSETIIWN